eukprot:s586_g37.t1
MPNGPEGGKKLIVAVTLNRAKGTKRSHKQLVEELLPACKAAGATKGFVLAEANGKLCKVGPAPAPAQKEKQHQLGAEATAKQGGTRGSGKKHLPGGILGMKTEKRIGSGKTKKNGSGQTKATGRTMATGKTKASGTGKTKTNGRTGKTKPSQDTKATGVALRMTGLTGPRTGQMKKG